MRILQLCYKPPFPPVDGGTMAIDNITQGLLQSGCDVKILTVSTDKHPFDESKITPQYRSSTAIEAVYIDTKIKPLSAFVSLLCGESYHVKRYVSELFAKKLVEILKGNAFDIVHIESIFLTPYVSTIRKHSDARIILRAHNVEHHIWRQLSEREPKPFKRWYLKHLSMALEHYEREHINDYDGVICITDNDSDAFKQMGCRRPTVTVPFAISPHLRQDDAFVEPMSLFHIGSMDWKPNIEAIDWFLANVWPLLHSEMPQVKLYLAGRHMPHRLLECSCDGVSVVGEVDDAAAFMSSKAVNIVPLLSGSGIRVKILEAMSMGKPVVATSVAARGINYTDGQDILIADTPAQFVSQIKRCLQDTSLAGHIAAAAMTLIGNQYDGKKQIKKIIDFYQQNLGLERT